ncbi:MAG: flagellar hook protein FlgE [Helicobacter sp.]|nr:flagellar hook protein FlgE [Helicobacter sp.]
MMRALWAGVSGMQAHQVGLDVTSNNIANVNTTGFKSSRANFSDMLYQTQNIGSSPYGDMGGRNAYSVGLGGEVRSTSRLHVQGSTKTTGYSGDLALDGNGFFVLSGDAGKTRVFTRDGRFGFDANGNFVNNSGYVVQGWVRNISSFERTAAVNDNVVDTTGPITSIQIDPKLVMPARATSIMKVSANLTSADKTDEVNFAYALDSKAHTLSTDNNVTYDSNGKRHQVAENMGTLFTSDGNAMKLQQDQGIWVSYRDAELNFTGASSPAGGYGNSTQSVKINGTVISFVNNSSSTNVSTRDAAITAINNKIDQTGVRAYANGSTGIQLINDNSIDGDSNTKNIRIDASSIRPPGQANAFFNTLLATQVTDSAAGVKANVDANGIVSGIAERVTAFRYKYTQQTNLQLTSANGRIFNTTEDLRRWIQYDANIMKNSHAFTNSAGATKVTGFSAGGAVNAGMILTISTYSLVPGDMGGIGGTQSPWSTAGGASPANPQANSGWARLNSVSVTMNAYGQFEILNKSDGIRDDDPAAQINGVLGADGNTNNLKITVANYQSRQTSSNVLFGQMMKGLSTGNLVEGGSSSSTASFKVPKLALTYEAYDSLGNKHNVTIEFRKKSTLEWTFSLSIPEPAEFIGASGEKRNVLEGGSVVFNRNGGLQSVQPNRFIFNPMNGAASPQQIDLDFGQNTIDSDFAGLTGTGEKSDVTGGGSDGWASGVMKGYSVDQNGVMMGQFTNGKTIAIAQVAVATFDNDAGLTDEGGNMYREGPNSGQATIGRANRAGNASIKGGYYEMSTADLSEELTQLIVIQRGYQANAKSVTTADQIFNTLLGLKQ